MAGLITAAAKQIQLSGWGLVSDVRGCSSIKTNVLVDYQHEQFAILAPFKLLR